MLTLETWDQKMRRLAEEMMVLMEARDALRPTQSRKWGDLTVEIIDKRYAITEHIKRVND